MDIIGLNCTRKLGKKITSNKCMNEIIIKRDEQISKKVGEIFLITKPQESTISDGERI